MQGVATEKVPGGKLLRIYVDYGEKINSVKITGDFFLHPEEAVEEIEKSLSGVKVNTEENLLTSIISNVVSTNKIELIGITPEAIARVIKGAMR